jgi:hypothetical protein
MTCVCNLERGPDVEFEASSLGNQTQVNGTKS